MTDFCASLSSPYSWLALQEKGLCLLEGISVPLRAPLSSPFLYGSKELWGRQYQGFYLHGARNLGSRKLAQRYSFIPSFIHSSFFHSFFHSFVHSFIHSLSHSLVICLLICSFIHCFIYSLVHLLIHSVCLFNFLFIVDTYRCSHILSFWLPPPGPCPFFPPATTIPLSVSMSNAYMFFG